jgi:hypothetical protein
MAIITAYWITGLLITNGLNRLFKEKRDIEAYIVVLIGLRSDLAYKWFHRLDYPLQDALDMASSTPSQFIGMQQSKGRLK